MRKIITNIATVASLSLAIVPVLGLTQAANAAEPTVRVAYADLNLATPAQAAIFKARVEAAGDQLCRAKLAKGQLEMPLRACIADAHRQADRQLSPTQRQALAYASHAKAVELAAK
ncbi:UrcA family protein [Caulobacter sp.]|jgi:UrcA family protein|uniref:UrcA family protein n=1 Tax=Caulobacter sp. TaxID=78 RepID=UPI00160A523A